MNTRLPERDKILWCRYCGKPYTDQDKRDEHEDDCFRPSHKAMETERAIADQLREEAFHERN